MFQQPKVLLPLFRALPTLSASGRACQPGDLTILSGKEKERYYLEAAKAIEKVARN